MRNTTVKFIIPKNTLNRHRFEMTRIKSMVTSGLITKEEAVDLFQDYLLQSFGRYAVRKFNYKKAA